MIKKKKKGKKGTPSRLAAGDTKRKRMAKEGTKKKERNKSPRRRKQGQLKSILEVGRKERPGRVSSRGGGEERDVLIARLVVGFGAERRVGRLRPCVRSPEASEVRGGLMGDGRWAEMLGRDSFLLQLG